MADFKAPYLSRDDLQARAEAFLLRHHPSRSIPVPIEHIVERLAQAGKSIIAIKELMGHSSITVTMRHAHLAPSDLAAAVLVLDRPRPVEMSTHRSTHAPSAIQSKAV